MVAQSGGIATTAFSMVQQAGFGCRYLVSSGNEAVVSFADYLYAFAQDEGTRIIGGYLEGILDGPKFLCALESARARTNRSCSSGRHHRRHRPRRAGSYGRAGRRRPRVRRDSGRKWASFASTRSRSSSMSR
jgi:hypothetical protein